MKLDDFRVLSATSKDLSCMLSLSRERVQSESMSVYEFRKGVTFSKTEELGKGIITLRYEFGVGIIVDYSRD